MGLLLGLLLGGSLGGDIVVGPYDADNITFFFEGMDHSSQLIDVFFPVNVSESARFPMIVYAHGKSDAAPEDHYPDLFRSLVSFGFIIVAPRACPDGCVDDKTSLPHDPSGFGHYYYQQLKAIDWAKNQSTSSQGEPVLRRMLDLSKGVAVAGHSMGGQATLFSSSDADAVADHDIKVAVMHHAYTHSYPAPLVPFLAFTSVFDMTARPRMTRQFFAAEGAAATKGLVNKVKADHSEPDVERYNPLLPQFTAAWIKLYLCGVDEEFGISFDDMIYGNSSTSMCAGGDGAMAECEVYRD